MRTHDCGPKDFVGTGRHNNLYESAGGVVGDGAIDAIEGLNHRGSAKSDGTRIGFQESDVSDFRIGIGAARDVKSTYAGRPEGADSEKSVLHGDAS